MDSDYKRRAEYTFDSQLYVPVLVFKLRLNWPIAWFSVSPLILSAGVTYYGLVLRSVEHSRRFIWFAVTNVCV